MLSTDSRHECRLKTATARPRPRSWRSSLYGPAGRPRSSSALSFTSVRLFHPHPHGTRVGGGRMCPFPCSLHASGVPMTVWWLYRTPHTAANVLINKGFLSWRFKVTPKVTPNRCRCLASVTHHWPGPGEPASVCLRLAVRKCAAIGQPPASADRRPSTECPFVNVSRHAVGRPLSGCCSRLIPESVVPSS